MMERASNILRDYLDRLTTYTQGIVAGAEFSMVHRRIMAPADAGFELEGTLMRLAPINGDSRVHYPGQTDQACFVAEWIERPEVEHLTSTEVGVDLAAFLGVASGNLCAMANEVPIAIQNSPLTGFLPTDLLYDSELLGTKRDDSLARFELLLRAVVALPAEQSTAYVNATRMRNAACNLLANDVSSAYGLLVGAIETLSRKFGPVVTDWDSWDQANEWNRFMQDDLGLSNVQSQQLKNKLLQNTHLRLKRTFIEYVMESIGARLYARPYHSYEPTFQISPNGLEAVPGGAHHEGDIELLVPRDPVNLRRRLGRSYDARSTVFHESVRLPVQAMAALPWNEDRPLPFAGLRLILDDLLETVARSVEGIDIPFPDVIVIAAPQ